MIIRCIACLAIILPGFCRGQARSSPYGPLDSDTWSNRLQSFLVPWIARLRQVTWSNRLQSHSSPNGSLDIDTSLDRTNYRVLPRPWITRLWHVTWSNKLQNPSSSMDHKTPTRHLIEQTTESFFAPTITRLRHVTWSDRLQSHKGLPRT